MNNRNLRSLNVNREVEMLKFFQKPAKDSYAPFLLFVGTMAGGFLACAGLYQWIGGWVIPVGFSWPVWFVIGMAFCHHYDLPLIDSQPDTVGDYAVRLIWWVVCWPLAVVFADMGLLIKPWVVAQLGRVLLALGGYIGMFWLAYGTSGGPHFWLAIVTLILAGFGLFIALGEYDTEEPLAKPLLPIRHLLMIVYCMLVLPLWFVEAVEQAARWLDSGGLKRYLMGERLTRA